MKFLRHLFTLGKFDVHDCKYCHFYNLGELCWWYHNLLKLCYVGSFAFGKIVIYQKILIVGV